MAKRSATFAASDVFDDEPNGLASAQVLDLVGVAVRGELFLAHAAAASRVAVYEFLIPEGATVQGLSARGAARDARAQLHLIVAITGGAVSRFPGGLAARVPCAAAQRFEALASPMIGAFLVAFRR